MRKRGRDRDRTPASTLPGRSAGAARGNRRRAAVEGRRSHLPTPGTTSQVRPRALLTLRGELLGDVAAAEPRRLAEAAQQPLDRRHRRVVRARVVHGRTGGCGLRRPGRGRWPTSTAWWRSLRPSRKTPSAPHSRTIRRARRTCRSTRPTLGAGGFRRQSQVFPDGIPVNRPERTEREGNPPPRPCALGAPPRPPRGHAPRRPETPCR
jgi:hypothetical protein